jgi:hypothetical protein
MTDAGAALLQTFALVSSDTINVENNIHVHRIPLPTPQRIDL